MALLDSAAPSARGPKPATEGTKRHGEQFLLYTFVIVPFLAFLHVITGKAEIVENPVGVGPLPEQIVVLKEMIVPERDRKSVV